MKKLIFIAILFLNTIVYGQYISDAMKQVIGRDSINNASTGLDTVNGITLYNGATCWEDMRISGLSIRPGASSPSYAVGTRTGGIVIPWFSGTATNFGSAIVQMSHMYLRNSAIHPHFHAYCEASVNGPQDTLTFGIEYMWLSIGDTALTPNETDTIYGFKVLTTDSLRRHLYFEGDSLIANVFSPTDKKASFAFPVRIFRQHDYVLDTYEQDAGLFDFDIHYQVNKIGTPDEYPN